MAQRRTGRAGARDQVLLRALKLHRRKSGPLAAYTV